MKKIISLIILAILLVFISQTNKVNAAVNPNEMNFVDSHAGGAVIPRHLYLDEVMGGYNVFTTIEYDDPFGQSYLVDRYPSEETIDVLDYKNWIGTKYYRTVPKYTVLVFQYPILLDTLIGNINVSSNTYMLDNFNPIMIVDGESYPYTVNTSTTITRSKSYFLERSFNFLYQNQITAEMPIYNMILGGLMSTTMQASIDEQYDLDESITISNKLNGTIQLDNTVGSLFYQNGETLFANFGNRAKYYYQVTVLCENLYYLTSEVTSGSWLSKKTNYYYNEEYALYSSMYANFKFHSTYQRGLQPFYYTWDSENRTYQLINQMRVSGSYYVR